MIDLLIIADDFTGALDTAVQFRKMGAVTCVVTDISIDYDHIDSGVQVLALDAETRHLPPELAYKVVSQVVTEAQKKNVKYIYKKTDSALRGNIGAELAALNDVTGKRVHFIPAFPTIGRTTKQGVHYIDGVPVGESIFKNDPFEPVTKSNVLEIIKTQTKNNTSLITEENVEKAFEQDGIIVYDAQSQEHLYKIGKLLVEKKELSICAGCAGFAEVLANELGYHGQAEEIPTLPKELLVVCGSVNPISIEQMAEAENQGVARIHLRLDQKFDSTWIEEENSIKEIAEWKNICQKQGALIIDSYDCCEKEQVKEYLHHNKIDEDKVRILIAGNLGNITKQLLDLDLNALMMITGGDTLMGLMNRINVSLLQPLCELFPGIVLSKLVYKEKRYYIISKSGAFGNVTLIKDIQNLLK